MYPMLEGELFDKLKSLKPNSKYCFQTVTVSMEKLGKSCDMGAEDLFKNLSQCLNWEKKAEMLWDPEQDRDFPPRNTFSPSISPCNKTGKSHHHYQSPAFSLWKTRFLHDFSSQ
jgi:hypothetical protein